MRTNYSGWFSSHHNTYKLQATPCQRFGITPLDFIVLEQIQHRPWPSPTRSWAMHMVWSDLLFAHWPVPANALRPLLPPELVLDTFDGEAWLGVVPFQMSETRLRGLPPVPGSGTFCELNVRTYVRAQHKPGVWFFSLDASSRLAVRTARRFFHLPYFDAKMSAEARSGWTHYQSRRTHRGAATAEFHARYQSIGDVFISKPNTLEHWLTERYCLYVSDKKSRVFRGDIHHDPWPLQRAEAEFYRNDMTDWLGFNLPSTVPHLLFAKRLEVVAWTLSRLDKP